MRFYADLTLCTLSNVADVGYSAGIESTRHGSRQAREGRSELDVVDYIGRDVTESESESVEPTHSWTTRAGRRRHRRSLGYSAVIRIIDDSRR